LRVNFSRVKVLMITFGNLLELVKGLDDDGGGHQDFEKGRKGETYGLLLRDFAVAGDLLCSQYLSALIRGTVVGRKSHKGGRRAAKGQKELVAGH
jgi:hypothetical protein